jgi:RES domain-containing protein
MISYRISKTRYASDLSGEGARLNGGRWNHKLTPCTYCSESRALAILEFTVNTDIALIARALSITTFEIPDRSILEIPEASLPGNWKETPAPSSTKDFGTNLLTTARSLILKIPSIVVPEEFNYIINPSDPEIGLVKIISVRDFIYDIRIKL